MVKGVFNTRHYGRMEIRNTQPKSQWTLQQLVAAPAAIYFGRSVHEESFFRALKTVDPDHFLDQTIRQGMAGILYRVLLEREKTNLLPKVHIKNIRRRYLSTAASNAARAENLKRILQQLDREKIPVVVLKGMALIETFYNDPGLRPMEDIDLWVFPDQYKSIVEALTRLGYQNDPLYRQTFRKRKTVLDIRTHLLDSDRIQARTGLMGIDEIEVFRSTILTHICGAPSRVLSASDTVLYLSMHALKHDMSRMIWLTDVIGFVKSWTEAHWQHLHERSKAWGQEITVVSIFYLMEQLFGIHFSPLKIINPKISTLQRYALRQRVNKKALPPWSSLLLSSTKKGLAARLRYVIETLFPRPSVLRQVFPRHAHLPSVFLYFLRTVQLFSLPFR